MVIDNRNKTVAKDYIDVCDQVVHKYQLIKEYSGKNIKDTVSQSAFIYQQIFRSKYEELKLTG